ncbi:conserved membrane hypothetical protein [Flavobacterium sp. 9AF]|uniref:hypothetical protein n=1 Tax=Flavobacterium sp. 9AF TaxID=2653142 RepID=UPI0012F1C69C|nr:hypothetical protein [Flavobacterium sp. 9AF]VXB90593.1 conserved membrane hypothetical protein [Flavobacterium sp. 9AF]
MLKKILFSLFAFTLGVLVAFLTEGFFRHSIQTIFVVSTSHKIIFVGKNFYLFLNNYYYFTFGVAFVILKVDNYNLKAKQILLNLIASLIIFMLFLIGIASLDAHLKLSQCTACNDGIRKIHWNTIDYGTIIGTSILFAVVPNFISLLKNNRSKD